MASSQGLLRVVSGSADTSTDVEIRIDNVADADWHAAMCQFADLHYEQTAVYGAHKTGEVGSHLMLFKHGRPIAGARLGLYTLPIINRGLALLRFGPFWRQAEGQTSIATYTAFVQALVDEYCTKRKHYLVVRPRAHPEFYPLESAALSDFGFRADQSTMLDRYLVDASLSEAEQRKSLSKRWRYNLKAGESHALEIRFGESPEAMDMFRSLYADMVKRKNLNYPGVDHVEYMPQLILFPEQMKLRVVLAYKDGEAIAGAAFGVVGDIAYYVFGASTDTGVDLEAGYVLQWKILNWLRENSNVRWYELGGPGDPGIQQFKKGLAGSKGLLMPIQEFHYCTDLSAELSVKGLFKLRDLRNSIQRWQRSK
ncbi:GNAT family N-acetyltransferase [Bradyrhizobium sp. G127]|uniref:lipid II:glycine glycyltransferase FemX n=1 Tax=Bradyrhizobium sp. G127 TaxID=2904800 RepID=UPI001F46F9E7|nr:GNAT family N-acetyltransferase [Bradyrhizobium sp. G127]MCF2521838.1 GNAT family N-acetyltransferase [Bradyrhizobium sp. G127]